MPEYSGSCFAHISDIPTRDGGFLLSPPIAWIAPGEQIATESGSYVTGNRISEKGELHGAYQPKLQDTYVTGTGSRTGKAFTVVTGTVKDDWVNPRTSKYGLLFPDATSGATAFDVVATAPDARIVNAQFVISRGANPVLNAPTGGNFYSFIHLCYANNTDLRVALLWGSPIRIDFYTNAAWKVGADLSKNATNIEAYFAANDNRFVMDVIANYQDDTVTIKIQGRDPIYFKWPGGLPNFGNVRVTGQNGYGHFEYYPLRFQPLTIEKKARDFGRIMPVGSAHLQVNGRAYDDPTQTFTGSLTGNAQEVGYTATFALPDAGDGLGSADPALVGDITLALPGVWVNPYPTGIFLPPVTGTEIVETFDDAMRTYNSSALVNVNNYNSRYTGSYGQVAVRLDCGSNVDAVQTVFNGIGGGGPRGIEFYRQDPIRNMVLPCSDNSVKMTVPIGEEICLDGYAWATAVRLVAELGNVHPQFLQTIPFYVPPGANAEAPFGPAGADWPGYILGKGSGLNAKYKFLPNESAWSILCQIIQEMSYVDPVSGQPFPYYMGFDPYGSGQFLFQPYNPHTLLPRIVYSERDVTGYGQIEEIHVYNSVYQMRTSLDFQGIDAFTNELLYFHLNMPDAVLQAVGYRFPWLERSAKFSSADYMQQIALAASVQAGLPTQCVTLKSWYHPNFHAGDVFIVQDNQALGGTAAFYATEIRSSIGYHPGGVHNDCFSYVSGRNIANF